MNETDPIGNDARDSERLKKLGPPPHICAFCGLEDPRALLLKQASFLKARLPRSVLEKHHVFLRDLDPDFTILLCVLCHFKVTQGYLWAGLDPRPEPNPRKRVALMLKALSVFLKILAKVVLQWSELLSKGELY